MARKEPQMVTLEIDDRTVSFPQGVTVHRAAELNGIYIPSLCSHKDLSPFGGCRLCMVEIEGRRGYPLSCDTIAKSGMKVKTDTAPLRELRKEILKLILSEHPSSCLVCDERANCKSYQGTIRKAGVTTGCRFCPNDNQCELQALVEKIGVTEIDYPILYHGYEPEHDDPFYDRDYNICILCGRCVRMCQEVRGTSILAFTYRGPRAKVGPAFGRSHQEAGCEFCGACVDVCPTGALADKASKWDEKPDGYLVSTCPFCAIGCQVELGYKNGRLSKVRANVDPEVNDGQLCVKGRFCMPEVTHHFERARKPLLKKGSFFREVSWQEALEKTAAELKGIPPLDFAMLVSPDLTNESLFAAQKFVRECLGGNSIDSSARLELAGGLGLWSRLFAAPISIKNISRSDVILAVGLDSRFNFSVVGTRIRQALNAGARLVTIDPREGNLARYTDEWLRPAAGREGHLLKFIADYLSGIDTDYAAAARDASVDPEALEQAVGILSQATDLTIVLGPQVFHYGDTGPLVDALMAILERANINLIPLYFGANARGALEMGVFPEIGPGGSVRSELALTLSDICTGWRRPKVIYLVGEIPFLERPPCDFLIVQDIYPPPFAVDAFLPACSFAETGGTLANIEGRVQEVIQVERLPEGVVTGLMRPDWQIFSDIANLLQCHVMDYKTHKDVMRDIRKVVPNFPAGISRMPRRIGPGDHPKIQKSTAQKMLPGHFWLVAEPGGYRHRGIDLSSKVGGLQELALEEGLRMNPNDMKSLELKAGDSVSLSFDTGRMIITGVVKLDFECPQGAVYYTRPVVFGGLQHRHKLWPLFTLRENPTRVNVSRAKSQEMSSLRVQEPCRLGRSREDVDV